MPLPSRSHFAVHPALLLQGTLPSRAPHTPALALLLGAVLPLTLAATGPLMAVLSDSDVVALCMPRALLTPTPIPLHPPELAWKRPPHRQGCGLKKLLECQVPPWWAQSRTPSDHKAYTPPPFSNPFGQKRVGTLRQELIGGARWGLVEARSGDPTPGGVQEAQASLGSVIAQPCQYLERIP